MDIIRDYSNKNDIILDPFLGSGTTVIACKKLNRHYIGIEINPKYVEIANKRLNFEMLDFGERDE
jgi:DNA modification methylase